MATIITKVEKARGCGYRKPGGFYFITEAMQMRSCGKLPLPLHTCPCCGGGIKFARGFTWISPDLLFKGVPCRFVDSSLCDGLCPMENPPEKSGLIWIGEKFYKTPGEWIKEAQERGVSRRIKNIPKDFKVGEDWVMVAHIHVVPETDDAGNVAYDEETGEVKLNPAIFHAFKPTAVEYVVTGEETEEKLECLEKKGITLVKVEKDPTEQEPAGQDGAEEAENGDAPEATESTESIEPTE
jgi:hypothetical protein